MKKALIFVTGLTMCACGGEPSLSDTPLPDDLTIAEIQGTGDSSPLEGQAVSVIAIVSADFQDDDAADENNLGGFYAQDEIPDADADTSDGIFVYDSDIDGVDVRAGQRVRVTGLVAEFFGETQIKATSVEVIGEASVRITDLSLPASATRVDDDGNLSADLERFEGMLVRFPQTLTVTDLRSLERFGTVGLAQGGRLLQFTNSNAPDVHGYEDYRRDIAARRITLDDGQRRAYPRTLRHLQGSSDNVLRGGATISNLTGALRFSRGSGGNGPATWRIMPIGDVAFTSNNPRPEAPPRQGAIRVASFNVLNFFAKIDTGESVCGSGSQHGCRGADSREELQRQLAKIVTALQMLQADIIGLIEVENDQRESVALLVDALNESSGENIYRAVETGSIGDDAIKTAFIYNSASVSLHGTYKLLDDRIDERFDPTRHRPALAQTFVDPGNGARLTVVINHFKSKGSDCDDSGDVNIRDGQGNCNLTREQAAIALSDWLAGDPTASGDPDFLVIGDLNAYLKEDPIAALQERGFINLLPDQPEPYSFVFDGQAGALDHALASPSLAAQVTAATEWHINADEAPLFDYNLENDRPAELFDATTPFRASDHDPLVIDLTLAD